MTKQEIFTKVARHLLKQNAQSTKLGMNGLICLYRGPEGRKCAVGVLIPNRLYSKDLEGITSLDAALRSVLLRVGIRGPQVNFVHELQVIHDELEPAEWLAALTQVARYHTLTMPTIRKPKKVAA